MIKILALLKDWRIWLLCTVIIISHCCTENLWAFDIVLPKPLVWTDKGVAVELPFGENKEILIKGKVLPLDDQEIKATFKLTFNLED